MIDRRAGMAPPAVHGTVSSVSVSRETFDRRRPWRAQPTRDPELTFVITVLRCPAGQSGLRVSVRCLLQSARTGTLETLGMGQGSASKVHSTVALKVHSAVAAKCAVVSRETLRSVGERAATVEGALSLKGRLRGYRRHTARIVLQPFTSAGPVGPRTGGHDLAHTRLIDWRGDSAFTTRLFHVKLRSLVSPLGG